jgi:hypothetical protein
MTAQTKIRDLVSISSADLTEVNIKRDFDDSHKIRTYLPNEASRRTLSEMLPGLMPTSTKRVHLITGTYGTGKSHFGLIISALLRKHPDASNVLAKIREKDDEIYRLAERNLKASKKYLIVVPDVYLYSSGFNNVLLTSLQETLRHENIDFRPKSHFQAAIDVINDWKEKGARSKEDNPYEKLAKALAVRGITPEILIDRLGQCSDSALRIFNSAHKEVAYGTAFQPNASITPAELYAETIEYLRNTGEWEGICVICDEFGRYLTKLAKDPTSWESTHIQEFSEYSKRSDENQCHLIIIAHQTLADYATGYRSQKEWEKISGRFIGNEYSLENVRARHETVEMISTIVTQQIETNRQRDTWQKIGEHPDIPLLIDDLSNADLYRDQGRDWVQTRLIKGCFPLHPLTTYCLPWLAQRVGQRQRTLFTFFNDPGENGLKHFIDTEIPIKQGRLNLYTLDRLIYYFGSAAEGKAQYRPTMRSRQEALVQIGESPLARRIINSLAVFEIVGPENLKPTEANLIFALHLPSSEEAEAKELLVELSDAKIIRPRASGFYELRRRGGEFDLQEAIKEAKDELRSTFNVLDAIEEMELVKAILSPIQARSYEKKHFVRRSSIPELATYQSLSNPKEYLDRIQSWYEPNRKKYEADVLILYLIAEDTDELEQAQKYVRMEQCQHAQFVVAIPKEPVQLTEILLEVTSAQLVKERLLANPSKEEADIEELSQIIADELVIVSKRLDSLMEADKLTWYCNGDSATGIEKGGEEEYISNLLLNCFAKTPPVRDSATVNVPIGRDTERKHRYDAMTRLLEQKGNITIKKIGGPAVDRILRNCLQETEVLEKREDAGSYADYAVRSQLPEGSVLQEIWQVLEKAFFKLEQRIELENIICKLLRPPYGLSNQLVEILLAAFFRNCLDEFVIFEGYKRSKKRQDSSLLTRISLNAPTIASIVADPGDYVAIYYEVRPAERKYVNGIIEVATENGENLGEMGVWERGLDALIGWFAKLPPLTTRAGSYQNENAVELVSLLNDPAIQKDAKEFFRQRLPAALGLTLASPPVPTEDEAEILVERFEACYIELINYAERQAHLLIRELAEIFGVKGSTREDLALATRNWYNSRLSESQRLHTFPGDAGYLKKSVEAEGPIEQRLLINLPKSMGVDAYINWVERSTAELFLAKVELAKTEIESWQPQSITPKGIHGDTPSSPIEITKVKIRALLTSSELSIDEQRQILEELLIEFKQ